MIFPQEGLDYMMEQVFDGNTFYMGLITNAAFSSSDTWASHDWDAADEVTVTGSVSGSVVSFTENPVFTVPASFYGVYVRSASELICMKTVSVGNETSFTSNVEIKFQ